MTRGFRKPVSIAHILFAVLNFAPILLIPFFRIPAHTVTFLLPSGCTVIMAALSPVSGVILILSTKKKA